MSKTGWIIIGAIVAFLAAIAIYNGSTPPNHELNVWDSELSQGSNEAPHTFVYYTDAMCPYCAKFHNALEDSSFKEEYLDTGKVHLEVRLSAMLEEKNGNSKLAGESTYCAANQNRFHEYYDALTQKTTREYFDKGIGVSQTSPKIPKLRDDYFIDVAQNSNLKMDEFTNCLKNGETTQQLAEATQKTAEALPYGSGVPYFVVNNSFTSSGFDGDYERITQMLRAGGVE